MDSSSKVILVCIAFAIVFIIYGILQERREKIECRARLKKKWGKPIEGTMAEERFRSLSAYLDSKEPVPGQIDEITWNDLEMDRIFLQLNATQSAVGEEYLYALLHQPEMCETELLKREAMLQTFQEQENLRLDMQVVLHNMGKLRNISVYDYMMRLSGVREEKNTRHYLALLGYLLCVPVGMLLGTGKGIFLCVVLAAYNMISYYKRKGEIEPFLQVVSFLMRWIQGTEQLASVCNTNNPELSQEVTALKEEAGHFQAFIRGGRALAPTNPTGNLGDVLLDYLRMLFHIDLIKFNQIYQIFQNEQETLKSMFGRTGRIDAMLAVASFRAGRTDWCIPTLHTGRYGLHTENLVHPLIPDPVANSLTAERPVLLTGSNASGKSTFLKTVAVNALLAQTIHTVCGTRYDAGYYRIMSSMALRDDLAAKESYYIVEIRSLKRILTAAEEGQPVLCFVDEVLRGTNTAERIAASTQILRYLAKQGVYVFAATHDLELTNLLEKEYDNYHFSEQVTEDAVLFDYQLKRGKANSRNAIRLLAMMDYPEHVVEAASKAVAYFLKTGEWNEG